MTEKTEFEPLRYPRDPSADAEGDRLEARRADEEERLRSHGGHILVNVEGSRRLYSAGEQIRFEPHQVGAAVTVTDENRMPLAVFSVPELGGKDAKLVRPGPLGRLTLLLRGKSATLHRELATADLSLLDVANWLRCHRHVAVVLAFTWMIIGVQVTLVEIVRGAFHAGEGFGNTSYDSILNAYLLGTIPGAMIFGWLADRIGRQRVYFIAALIYLATTFGTAFLLLSPTDGGNAYHRYALTAYRFLAGLGIGGEYLFLYTAVQELMPKNKRGWACLRISATFWLGFLFAAAVGAALTHFHLDEAFLFIVGGLGFVILWLRTLLPESPRWLVAHNRRSLRAEQMLKEIRVDVENRPARPDIRADRLLVPAHVPAWWRVPVIMIRKYPKQTLVGLTLLCTQAFFYNPFFFSFGPMLERFYGDRASGLEMKLEYYVCIVLANFAGPFLLARYFDTIGRKTMIVSTYVMSACALLGAAALLHTNYFSSPLYITAAWTVIFFFASTAASSAYLTAGESFPSEIRALAFAILFGLSMACGVLGWFVYGSLIKDAQLIRSAVSIFCVLSAGAMVTAASVELFFGIEYSGESIDRYSPPLFKVTENEGIIVEDVML